MWTYRIKSDQKETEEKNLNKGNPVRIGKL